MDFHKEQCETWASDFCGSDATRSYSRLLLEYAPSLLSHFLEQCSANVPDSEEISLAALSPALEGLKKFEIPDSLKEHIPGLCADFLEDLQARGRLGNGFDLAQYVRIMKFQKNAPIVRPGSPLGRNDPCPCGSGKKYKKCCKDFLK